ncbi:Uncharacterised protein [Shigella sonnei]|nr:Uncharacterised protein [Shigella sonnei]CSS42949.1 Uncharacterised protein [Shigella sonnei]
MHLVVRGKRDCTGRAVEATFCRVNVSAGNGGAHGFAGQAEGGNRLSVKFDANSRTLTAGKRHQADAGNLRDFLRDAGFHHIFHLRHRHGG